MISFKPAKIDKSLLFLCEIAALPTATAIDKEILTKPPLPKVSFLCVETEPKQQTLLFQFQFYF